MYNILIVLIGLVFLLSAVVQADEDGKLSRQSRQIWQWPSSPSSQFNRAGRNDDSVNSDGSSIPNVFNQNFINSASPTFGGSPSFLDLAESAFGGTPPKVDNFFASSANLQSPSSFSSPSGNDFNFPRQPLQMQPLQMQPLQMNSDLQTQISNIFQQNGMWNLPQNFVHDQFNAALQKSAQQFGGAFPSPSPSPSPSPFPSPSPSPSPSAQTSVTFGNLPTGFSSLQFGSPGSQSDMFAGTQPASLAIARNALTMEDFSKSISTQLNLNRSKAAGRKKVTPTGRSEDTEVAVPTFPTIAVDQTAVPASLFPDCEGNEQPVVAIADFLLPDKQPDCAKNKYRSHTGECNNICFPTRGKESTVFIRLIGPDYADGISEPRKNSRNKPLPSARLVSSSLISTRVRLAPTWTNMLMQFGQFLDHDITQTPRPQLSDDAPQCCGASNPHPQCFSIEIPADDPFYSKMGETCMEFVRSLPGVRPGCRFGPRQQMNQQTAYIDASQIYGVKPKNVKALREFTGGRLKTIAPFPHSPSYTLLPAAQTSTTCVDGSEDKPCFNAGDNRCNVQVGLQTMHTVWMRHHNNLVDRLAHLNPDWNDEKLYQEARAIVAAQLQHIAYNEWLPMLLGQDTMDRMGLRVLDVGRFTGYNVSIHPGLINEFSAAAFRVGHAMVPGNFFRLTGNGQDLKSSVKVRDTFFKSNLLYEEGAVDELIRGMVAQQGKAIENSVTADLSQQLFFTPPALFGLDLVSLNIQRGRDHGLTGWMKWRKLCGLPTVDNFNDLKGLNVIPADMANRLASLYETVDDIDLYPAGIAEFPVDDSLIGPTFSCIISEQFWRLRVGDRFWYENQLPLASTFSDDQLTQIRRSSLARILCDTVPGLQFVQANVFATVSDTNPRLPCAQITAVSLKAWAGI